MSDKKIVIVTEANERVATGHLMECIACAEELIKYGYILSFWINHNAEEKLKRRIPCSYQEYIDNIEDDFAGLVAEIQDSGQCIVIFNLREISGDFLIQLKKMEAAKIMCIDEYGHRYLPADIIINPMIDSYYWQYEGEIGNLYCGAKYLLLDKDLNRFHQMKKIINEDIGSILITMGGVDPKNYTISLMREIPGCFPDARIDIVVGGGNRNRVSVYRETDCNDQINIYENISNMPEMIYNADLIICAGGNTLHEAACIGTPAIVFPSMPHEVRTARCFADNGFGYVVDVEYDWKEKLREICYKLRDYSVRQKMHEQGKRLSDGLGLERIINIIQKMAIEK